MCGITGFWNQSNNFKADDLTAIAKKMSDSLLHRGPDNGGIWTDGEIGIALGHRRLSIVDLSPEGHQPMLSAQGRYVIVFNGEIYNFGELRRELMLLGHNFRGHSDTEIMLAAFSEWDVEQSVQRFNGMFAFALWDRQERLIYLVRDRLGEKPLYYGWIGNTLIFASELKAIKAYPDFHPEINRDALALFLQYSYVPAPYSIYQNIYKLPAGTSLTWNGINTYPAPVAYWSVKQAAEQGVSNLFIGSVVEAEEQLEKLLFDSVGLRMLADVPLGAFLSGGIDSSLIVALMQAQSNQPTKTFTMGFHEDAYNEAQYAKAVAQHLGTDHTELYVSSQDALDVIPKLPTLYDEPFADASSIPTFLVSQLARQHVTVSLSGDGGDELFGGYNRYLWGQKIWNNIGWMPLFLRKVFANILTSVSPQIWDYIFENLPTFLPSKFKQSTPGNKLHKLATILGFSSPEAMYTNLISHWQNPQSIVRNTSRYPDSLSSFSGSALTDFTQLMMYCDTTNYLPDDILVKVDRAGMGVSLEGRIPFLDHRLVEFAWTIPMSMKIQNGQGKSILRKILYKYVPQHLIERPKSGFTVPIDGWLRGSLRDWAEPLLDENRLEGEGFFDSSPIRKKWEEHISSKANHGASMWDILMFQACLETNS